MIKIPLRIIIGVLAVLVVLVVIGETTHPMKEEINGAEYNTIRVTIIDNPKCYSSLNVMLDDQRITYFELSRLIKCFKKTERNDAKLMLVNELSDDQ